MSRPAIIQDEGQLGFYWQTSAGAPVTLGNLVATDDEPDRLLATHLEALDDALIIAVGRFGEILGGGRTPADRDEERDLRELHRQLDRLIHEYADALGTAQLPADVRGGQIIGTATLVGIRARAPLGLLGPAPLDGELNDPGIGVVAGFGDLVMVDEAAPWRGGRWVVRTEAGERYPATLSMLLHDSSGVHKDAALEEHRSLIAGVLAAADRPEASPTVVACALDWLIYDYLMAHRDGPDSLAIELKGGPTEAALVISAADTSARCRATIDPGLLDIRRK